MDLAQKRPAFSPLVFGPVFMRGLALLTPRASSPSNQTTAHRVPCHVGCLVRWFTSAGSHKAVSAWAFVNLYFFCPPRFKGIMATVSPSINPAQITQWHTFCHFFRYSPAPLREVKMKGKTCVCRACARQGPQTALFYEECGRHSKPGRSF